MSRALYEGKQAGVWTYAGSEFILQCIAGYRTTLLTRQMTSGEMKFALQVECALNTIPEPEFRQLMVEALMVLSLIVEYNVVQHFGGTVQVERIVTTANTIFLQDQVITGYNCT